MRSRFLLLATTASFVLIFSACHHSDVTGPSDPNYVHVRVVNGSSVSIFVPAILANGEPLSHAELVPGAGAEIPLSRPDLLGSSFTLARSASDPQPIASISFTFARRPADGRTLAWATIRVVAEPRAPISATTDRPDLLSITSIQQF